MSHCLFPMALTLQKDYLEYAVKEPGNLSSGR